MDELRLPLPAKELLNACAPVEEGQEGEGGEREGVVREGVEVEEDVYSPLCVMDLQHLLLYSMQGMQTSYSPR